MWLGFLEAVVWLSVESLMVVSFFKLSGRATRGLMASGKKSLGAGAKRNAQAENWGQTVGGTDFLLARPGAGL